MAKVPVEETSGSGTDTQEYKCLLDNHGDCIATLKALPAAKSKLVLKYQEKKWISPTENPTEQQLLTQALDRVRTKASEFSVFFEMLDSITGLDLILEKLQIEERSGPHKCYVSHSCDLERPHKLDTTDGQNIEPHSNKNEQVSMITPESQLLSQSDETPGEVSTSLETVAHEAKDSGAKGTSLVTSTQESVLLNKLTVTEQKLKLKEEQQAKLAKIVKEKDAEILKLKGKLEAQGKENTKIESERARLQAKLDETTAQSDKAKSECAKLSIEVDTLKREVTHLNNEISELTKKVDVLEKKNEEHEHRSEERERQAKEREQRAEQRADERHQEVIQLIKMCKIEEKIKPRMEDII